MFPLPPLPYDSFSDWVLAAVTVLMNTGQVLCRVSLNLGLSDGFPTVRLGLWVLVGRWRGGGGDIRGDVPSLSAYPGNMLSA